MSKGFLIVAVWFCFVVPITRAQSVPIDVSYCDLATNPKLYDTKTIRVRGTLSVEFEDFSLFDKPCKSDQGIWLAFGGDVPGIVASMANDTQRTPGKDVTVNGTGYAIQKDENFRRLYALITTRKGDKSVYSVTATLEGAFFAGEPHQGSDGVTRYLGYGHLGCCSLLVITHVSDVDSVPPANLNLRGVVIGPDGKPAEALTIIDEAVGGSPPQRQTTVTDKQGRFTFSNSGQQLRIASRDYRPVAITVKPGGAPVRVKLQDAKRSDWILPSCGGPRSSSRLGFSVLFTIPQTLESKRFDNDDLQSFFVYPRGRDELSADVIITHSPDEMTYGFGSVGSKWFEARWVKDDAGNVIGVDARSRLERGRYRRSLVMGHFFSGEDIVGYEVPPRKRPNHPGRKVLDQIIDSACVNTVPLGLP